MKMKVKHVCSQCGTEEELEVEIPRIFDLIQAQSGEEKPPDDTPGWRKYFVICTNATCGVQFALWAKSPEEALERACVKHNLNWAEHDSSARMIYGEEGVFRACRGAELSHM